MNSQIDFWRELLEEAPDILKLQTHGSKITTYVEKVTNEFHHLQSLNENNVKTMKIFGHFLQDIIFDDVESVKLLEKTDYILQSGQYSTSKVASAGFLDIKNTAIVSISGNFDNLCQIRNVNNQITNITGYATNQLLGFNVNKMIPKIIADRHNFVVSRFLETAAGTKMV